MQLNIYSLAARSWWRMITYQSVTVTVGIIPARYINIRKQFPTMCVQSR